LVEDADSLFKYYIGNTYITNIPLICLLLIDITFDDSLALKIISVVRCIYVLIQLMVLSVIAVMINSQVGVTLVQVIYTIIILIS